LVITFTFPYLIILLKNTALKIIEMYLRGTLYLFISAITIFFSTAYSQTDSAANVAQVKTDTAHRTFALIMGISTYKFIRPLSYADSDAELFRDFLKSPGGGK
jgi:hypothetical protein